MLYKKILLLFFAVVFVLTGCQTPYLYNQTEDNVADVAQRAKDARNKSDEVGKATPPLVVNQGLYVDRTPINLAKDPAWLKSRIILHGGQLPFSYYGRTIVGGNGHILIHYQAGVDPSLLTTLNYSGSVKGALDLLAAKTGYVYVINGSSITWQAFVTKTFDIAFMPGAPDYALGDSGGGGSGGGAAAASGGGGGATSAGGISGGAGQHSSLAGKASIWDDLNATIPTLMSVDGKMWVSQSTTSLTVRDRPANVALVTKYIENLNKNLSKQVLVKIQVLEVTLNSAFNYGINWNVIQGALGGTDFVLNANYGTPVSITSLSGGSIPAIGLQGDKNFASGIRETTIQVLVNALKQQGKVSVVTEPRVVCLNNQVSVINIVNKQGYAASVSSTSLGGTSGAAGTITSAITPGTVISGLVLYLLPKIMDNKVYLTVNADLSNLVQIQPFTSGSGSGSASIQVPQTTEKEFNQRSVISSGDTLILSGFRQVQNQSGAMQLMDSQALGGKGASQTNTETIVLITPIILHGTA